MIHEEKRRPPVCCGCLAHRCGRYNRQCSRQDLLPSAVAVGQRCLRLCRPKRLPGWKRPARP